MANDISLRGEAFGDTVGGVRVLLRLEGAALLLVGVLLYARSAAPWGRFAALLFVPDLAFLGYLWGARAGAIAYNATHSSLGPLLLAAVAVIIAPSLLPIAFIWIAHVGMDRAFGYGLKYASGFSETHLGRIGRAPPVDDRLAQSGAQAAA